MHWSTVPDDRHGPHPLGRGAAPDLLQSLLGLLLAVGHHRPEGQRLADVCRVAAHVRAVLPEHVEQVPVVLEVAVEAVPDVAVLGDDPQRPALARAADHERQVLLQRLGLHLGVLELEVLALEAEPLLRPEAAQDVTGLVEHVHSHADAREGDPVLLVLDLVPGGAHPQLEPAARDVVDGGRHVRDDGRVAVGHAQHEHPAAHLARLRRHCGEKRQALELGPGYVAGQRQEVVEVRHPLEAELLAANPDVPVVLVARVLGP